ncbi:TetR/AcrR family transcriptional regulator [Actinocrispum wychmicini]|uniref:TetR family transcriptional regulator n=1 Tax=Actinocrispum wychmicini TaxID=1213861 RepID=A0A4R2JRB2_9PSEU|nr:TetR/AcrR family transcriptional regulator [Actinocrispum wychmicini]TCO62791.1 TetR family transcriptional regulator [Actinocrispum wychmicini]
MEARERRTKWGDRIARERDIRESALALLEANGYQALSMRAVAEGAQVSLGTLYTYFASKEELYATLYAQRLGQLAEEFEIACAAVTSIEDALVAIAETYFEVHRVFGRELDLWAVDGLAAGISDEVVAELMKSALRVHGTAAAAMARLEPAFAVMSEEKRLAAVQLVWITVIGLAEHFHGARAFLYQGSQRKLIEQAAEVLVAGFRAVLLEPLAVPPQDGSGH